MAKRFKPVQLFLAVSMVAGLGACAQPATEGEVEGGDAPATEEVAPETEATEEAPAVEGEEGAGDAEGTTEEGGEGGEEG